MKEKLLRVLGGAGLFSLCGYIFFIPISKAAIEIFFGFLLFCFLLRKIFNPDFKFLRSREHILLLFFVIFMALSLFNSGPFLIKSTRALFGKWLKFIIVFIIAQDVLHNSPKRIRICMFVLLGMGCIVGLDAFSQKFLGIEFMRNKPMIHHNVTAPFQHYNDFAVYLVFILSLAIALLISKIKASYKMILSLLAVLWGVCLLFTSSRGGWLGFVASLFLMLILSKKGKVLFLAFIIFLILLFLIPGIKQRIMFTFQSGGDATRFTIWRGAIGMIKERPLLGKGLGTFMDYFPSYAPNLGVQYAHNCYLQIWAETGFFSLLSFILFLALVLASGIKAFLKSRNSISLGLICGVFGFLIHSFFDTHFYSLQLSALFWMVLGVLQASTKAALNQS